jgi:hypothetical protein
VSFDEFRRHRYIAAKGPGGFGDCLAEGGMRTMRRAIGTLVVSLMLAGATAVGTAQPAAATIDELVASFCSGGNGNLEPPGQSDPAKRSFVRALQATGTSEIHFGVDPAGTPGNFITVHLLATPASKFTPTTDYISFPDPFSNATLFLQVATPNSPAFAHCPKLTFPTE